MSQKRSGRWRPELSEASKRAVLFYLSRFVPKVDISFSQYLNSYKVSTELVGKSAGNKEEKALRKKVDDYRRKLINDEDTCKFELAKHGYEQFHNEPLILNPTVQEKLTNYRQAKTSANESTTHESTTPASTKNRDGDDSASTCDSTSDEITEEGTVEDEGGEGGKRG